MPVFKLDLTGSTPVIGLLACSQTVSVVFLGLFRDLVLNRRSDCEFEGVVVESISERLEVSLSMFSGAEEAIIDAILIIIALINRGC